MNSQILSRSNSSSRTPGFLPFHLVLIAALSALSVQLPAQTNAPIPVIHVDASQITAQVSPILYGLMTEEINFAYDGGLYAELVRNRTFKDDATNAVHWQVIHDGDSAGTIALDDAEKVNDELNVSLRLDVTKATGKQPVGIANEGYWGIPVKPSTRYHYSFWAKAGNGFSGPVTVSLINSGNTTNFANAKVLQLDGKWKKYQGFFVTGRVPATKDNLFTLSVSSPGTVWFSQPSLMPPTYHNRTNGLRPDLMQLLADMKPSFLRFPGGNYLEGEMVSNRFDWKNTVGGISERPGHRNDGWGYWSSDGMGLLEFLEWCEDLHMQPVLAVYAGYSMRQGAVSGPELDGFVKDALDEIEYVTGDANTTWGSQRIRDGHREPFRLDYVEIGNEDYLGSAGQSYDARFTKFAEAIRAKYPKIKLISTTPTYRAPILTSSVPDVIDDHYYFRSAMLAELDAHHYDSRDRSAPKIFIGEWATREGYPTPNMASALGDAAWMTGMERNSDVVIMSSYAPLFVNVSEILPGGQRGGSMQWRTDLIGYDALGSYGSPSYYAQKMFSTYHGDTVLAATADNIPTVERQAAAPAARAGQPAAAPPPPQQVPTLFFVATRDAKNRAIFLKIVNTSDKPQPVAVEIAGGRQIKDSGQIIEMSADPATVNTIQEPTKVAPVTRKANGLGDSFKRTVPAYSITIVQLETTI